ncbi:MAG TPA: hypothetical protein VGF67_32415 [Ktedonobacteraceae bacterium]
MNGLLFKGLKAGSSWSWVPFSPGLPESAVTDLAIHAGARLLRAATHGRSVWEIDLVTTSGLDPDLYLQVNDNDSGRLSAGNRQPRVEGHLDPTHVDLSNPYVLSHWMSADIKVRRSSLPGLPPLASPVDSLDFAVNIGDYIDSTQHIETADVSGLDRIFVEVHNRSLNALPAAQVRVLLLVADASAGLPALPCGYSVQINAGNTDPAWPGSSWHFVDPASPYRTLVRDLDMRTPQVVAYQFDYSTPGLVAGHDQVWQAVLVTAPGDPLTSTTTSLDQLTLSDKHVAPRTTHLVALGATPGTAKAATARTLVIDFHNPGEKTVKADLVFDRAHFPGQLSLLPRLPELAHPEQTLAGFQQVNMSVFEQGVCRAQSEWSARLGEQLERAGEWLERETGEDEREEPPRRRLRKLARLDRKHIFLANADERTPSIKDVLIAPHGVITAAVTIQTPPDARPEDRFRLDIVQRHGARIAGGSTYIIVITRPAQT